MKIISKMNIEKSKEWHAARRLGVGGSDVAAVLNLPPYGCSRRLWYEKRAVEPDFPTEINPAMQRGIYLEDIVRGLYAEKTLNRVEVVPVYISKEHLFMRGDVDGLIHTPEISDKDANVGVLEIKCPGREMYNEIKYNGIPEYYLLQGAHYMFVSSLKWMEYAIFCADLWELLVVRVERDDELIKMIIREEEHFWKLVENGPVPERLENGDDRCSCCSWRLSCWQDLWKASVKKNQTQYEEWDDKEFAAACEEHAYSKELLKQAKVIEEESKTKLKKIVGNREKVSDESGNKVNYKWVAKTYVNNKLLKEENQHIVKKYEYEGGSRVFNFYVSKTRNNEAS